MTLPPRIFRKRKSEKNILRSREHLNWLKTFACCVPMCNSEARIDPAHIKMAGPHGMGMKPPDDCAVSLCRDHHNEMERELGEVRFQEKYGLDLVALCREFASVSPALKRLRGKSA